MVQQVSCPECSEPVALCDNAVRLDVPAVDLSDEACWTVMQLGHLSMAAAGGPAPPHGKGHTLHRHQPEED